MKEQAPSGRDVDRIRETLANAAPPDEGSTSRADAVMRRARRARSRNGLVGAVAVGLAAAAVIIGPQFIDSSPVTNPATNITEGTTAAPSSSPATRSGSTNEPTNKPAASRPDPFLAHRCPAEPVEARPSGSPVLELQATDVMVRLCRASGAGIVSPWEPPRDGLVDDLGAFADRIAELPVVEADLCPAARPIPQPFAMQVTDFAGETRTMVSILTNCGSVEVNSRRVSAEALLRVLTQSLAAQRATVGFEPDAAAIGQLECHDPGTAVRPDWMSEITHATRFIAAITCMPPSDRSGDQEPILASDAAVELLNEEWASNARDLRSHEPLDVDRCPAAAVAIGEVLLVTTRGDVEAMRMVMCGNARIGGHFQLIPSKQLLDGLSLPYLPGVDWTVPGN